MDETRQTPSQRYYEKTEFLVIGTRQQLSKVNISSITVGNLASQADVLRGSSRVPAPRTSAEPKDKFLSYCSQISAGDHIQIIGDPIGAVEVKVLTSQTHTYKLCRV